MNYDLFLPLDDCTLRVCLVGSVIASCAITNTHRWSPPGITTAMTREVLISLAPDITVCASATLQLRCFFSPLDHSAVCKGRFSRNPEIVLLISTHTSYQDFATVISPVWCLFDTELLSWDNISKSWTRLVIRLVISFDGCSWRGRE